MNGWHVLQVQEDSQLFVEHYVIQMCICLEPVLCVKMYMDFPSPQVHQTSNWRSSTHMFAACCGFPDNGKSSCPFTTNWTWPFSTWWWPFPDVLFIQRSQLKYLVFVWKPFSCLFSVSSENLGMYTFYADRQLCKYRVLVCTLRQFALWLQSNVPHAPPPGTFLGGHQRNAEDTECVWLYRLLTNGKVHAAKMPGSRWPECRGIQNVWNAYENSMVLKSSTTMWSHKCEIFPGLYLCSLDRRTTDNCTQFLNLVYNSNCLVQ